MIRVATASEMQELDRRAAAECGIPSLLLMENAGGETVREMLAAFPEAARSRVLVLCGRGNNGGDGFVIARRLLGRGLSVRTILLARREDIRGDARINLDILGKLGAAPIEIGAGGDLSVVEDAIGSAGLVVDALLGTGAQGPARGLVADSLAKARSLADEVGYPLIAKPDIGVGAATTYLLHSRRELTDFFEQLSRVASQPFLELLG